MDSFPFCSITRKKHMIQTKLERQIWEIWRQIRNELWIERQIWNGLLYSFSNYSKRNTWCKQNLPLEIIMQISKRWNGRSWFWGVQIEQFWTHLQTGLFLHPKCTYDETQLGYHCATTKSNTHTHIQNFAFLVNLKSTTVTILHYMSLRYRSIMMVTVIIQRTGGVIVQQTMHQYPAKPRQGTVGLQPKGLKSFPPVPMSPANMWRHTMRTP